MVRVAKDHYGLSSTDAAVVLNDTGFYTLRQIQTEIAYVYDLQLKQAVVESLIALGKTSFAEGIPTLWGMGFELPELASIARQYYRLTAAVAIFDLQQSNYFNTADIIDVVTLEYAKPTEEAISDMLVAGEIGTLDAAIPFLRNYRFELRDIVRAGKNHYGLTGGNTSAALIGSGFYNLSQIQTEVAYVYGQPLDQVIIESLGGLGIESFDQAIPELWKKGYELSKFARVAKDYYHLKASETIYALKQSPYFGLTNIMTAVADEFGKPTEETMAAMLANSGIEKLEAGVYLLQRMGYSIQDIVAAAKEQYGLAAGDAVIKLVGLGVASTEIVQWAVSSVYEQSVGTTAIDYVLSGGIRNFKDAIPYLRDAGVTLLEITETGKSYYGETPTRLATALHESNLFQLSVILQSVGAVFSDSTDALVTTMLANGYTEPKAIADNLRLSGIRLDEIARVIKSRLGPSEAELRELLQSTGAYAESAIEKALEAAFSAEREQERLASSMMKEVIKLNDIFTAEGAIAFMRGARSSLTDIVTYLKEQHGLTVAETTEMLKPYYRLNEIGLATTKVYLANGNLKHLSSIMDPLYVSDTPIGLARFMYKKFMMSDIISAMKWFYGLDAQQTLAAFAQTDIPKPEYTNAVIAYFGNDVLYDYLASMKAKGATSGQIATELEHRGQLETVKIVYLANLLKSLGYDTESILRTVFYYFSSGRGKDVTVEDHAEMFVALGFTRPIEIVDGLGYAGYLNSAAYAHRIFATVKIALPNASMTEIAAAMKEYGHNGVEIMKVLDSYDVRDDSVLAFMKAFGYSAERAYSFMSNRTHEERIYWMVKNGYSINDYLKYIDYQSANSKAIATLRANGVSVNEIATAMDRYNLGPYRIGYYLYRGGVTNITELSGAMLAARSYPAWVLEDMKSFGPWSMKEIAQAMLDSNQVSLVDLASALKQATDGNLTETYKIIREVSKKEQKAMYDSLSDIERKILGNDDIAVIVTLTAMRSANINVEQAAEQLRSTERLGFEMAGVMLAVSGYNIGDALEALWNVYRLEIGMLILKTMIGQTITKVLTELNDYYKIGNIVYKIVKKTMS